ncbi:reverse transcriptase domain-containing protein [Exiguobacterium sp. AT1b]|uniref:RNA-directed DNA polymerase (Reverse transcriptase) n=1 Tax=Exiguobacterium sp. (strain ATCC BAA-1283 / AT1b) TaxID=360911 RepID=C4L5F2_EXISA|nr:reverse transcriptase domain-containing protein [Exiguobacterium sp. AT1b]ACQ69767.1 RNA-directed DNA polymerase (Reverse transcriptase) [Exiguobacterium sp. AT1b]
MALAFKLFNKKFTKKYIESKYDFYISNNTASGIDKLQKKKFDLIKNDQIQVIVNKVRSGTYKFTFYKENLIIKNRDSLPRMISIPTLRDRIVMKVLHEILRDTFKIELKLVQSVIKKLTEESTKYDSYIKIDISNFFGTLDQDLLMKKIKKRVRKKEILCLIEDSIKTPTVNSYHRKENEIIGNFKGVPQGIPISNVLAEIYLKDLDYLYLQRQDLAYFRYVDDILILCNKSDVFDIESEIKKYILEEYNLNINFQKSTSGSLYDGINYLGYTFEKRNDNLFVCSVKKESLIKIENSLASLLARFKNLEGKMKPSELIFYLNLKITGAFVKDGNDLSKETEIKTKKYGWLFFYSQINDLRVLYHLDYLVDKFIDKYDKNGLIDKLLVKKFVKSYYEITQKRNKSHYIFNPSSFSIEDKKQFLIDTFAMKTKDLKTEASIDYHFNIRIKRKILELEEDIQTFS